MDYEKKKRKNETKESAHLILVAVLLTAHFTTLIQGGYGEVFHNVIGSLAVLESSATLYKMSGWKLSELFHRIGLLKSKKEKEPILLLSQREIVGLLPEPKTVAENSHEKEAEKSWNPAHSIVY